MPLVLLIQWSDMTVGGTMLAGPFPPLAACLQWAALLAIDTLLSGGGRPPILRRGERLVVFAVWAAASMAAGRGMVHPFLSSLVGGTYYARSGVGAQAVAQHLPGWLAVTDKAAARAFFEGHGVAVPWTLWTRPLLTWAGFFVPFLTANLCLCALFERIWVRSERLAFPLVALPVEALALTDGTPKPPAMRLALRLGMGVPILLHGFGVAHAYLPGIPCLPFYNDVSGIVNDPPWNALRPLYLNIYPLLIGLTFLAPTDVTFSVWFFLLLNKIEMVAMASGGWNDGVTGGGAVSSPPYLEEQSAGAYLALATLLCWNARRHLGGIGRALFRRGQNEYTPYRPLAWGLLVSVAGTLGWCVWTGMPLWFAAGYFGFYAAVALVLSRLMAEGGVSWILAPILPDKLILSLSGSGAVSPMVLTRLMLHVQHLRDTRQMLLPALMEGGKLRDTAHAPRTPFYGLLLAGVLFAFALGVLAALPRFYASGALSLAPNSDGLQMSASVIPLTGVNQASDRLLHPIRPSFGAGIALFLGAGITLLLSALRTRFLWWTLHPLGYALTGTLQQGYANKMLFSVFLGWSGKALTLRFGGVTGFRLLREAALGLSFGDLAMGAVIKGLDALLGPSGYAIF